MKKLNRFILLSLLSCMLTTCKKDHMFDCFKSAGDKVTVNRDAAPFSEIQLDDNIDLIIHPNTTPYIKVTAGENIIDGIITELSGNKLYIRNENRCNWMRSFKNTYTVEVGMDKPKHIVYYGSGDISCIDTIRTPDFIFDCTNGSGSINFLINSPQAFFSNHTGRTDMHVKGFCGVTYIYVNDVGTFESKGLESGYTYIRNHSTGDIKVNASKELGVEIQYNGNIYYSGNPPLINQIITGKGKLIKE